VDDEVKSLLRAIFGTRLRLNEPLKRHGTLKVGGTADAWVSVKNEQELLALIRLTSKHSLPLMLIGTGSNILFSEQGARGVVARMQIDEYSLTEQPNGSLLLYAGAGVLLPTLANDSVKKGVGGLEWGISVPGTVGGGIVNNAGAHGACIADILEFARVVSVPTDLGVGPTVYDLPKDACDLGYRRSRFRAKTDLSFDGQSRPISPAPRAWTEQQEIVVGGAFLLQRDDTTSIRARIMANRQYRKTTQPSQPSLGSIFKNPLNDYAGRLIEAAGLKGAAHGGAQISSKHANFIVNNGQATASDILALIALARRTVLERFGIALELEVQFGGDWK
jgi:UDP-N-acetylmuramate dehydrogenase